MKTYMKPAPPVIMMFMIPSRGSNLVEPIRSLEGLWVCAFAMDLGPAQVGEASTSAKATGGTIFANFRSKGCLYETRSLEEAGKVYQRQARGCNEMLEV